MSNEAVPAASTVQSVDRAVSALELLARMGEAGVSEVAAAVGVHKSTASRLLAALQARGLVETVGSRGRYRLGSGILRLAGAMGGRLDVTSQGREICDELASAVRETVNIAVRRGEQVVNVYQAHGGAAVSVDNWVGRPTPLHATSSGKVLLAFGPTVPDTLLTGPHRDSPGYQRYTPDTVVDPGELADQLVTARLTGFATTVGEYELGLNAVAAPIFGAGESGAVAALSVSGPAFRLPVESLPAMGERVVAAAAGISVRLGHLR